MWVEAVREKLRGEEVRKNGPSANGKRRRGAVGSEVVGEDRMLTEGLFGIGGCDTG